jgi:predicted regulator of Ras-like GTPase activity (Roadblock/LC7/MglB family)
VVVSAPIQQLIDGIVDGVEGVTGAVVASADGFVIAARLPEGASLDAPALAAMSAATLGLAGRLVGTAGRSPVELAVQRSSDGQVFVFAAGSAAALTVLAHRSADAHRIERIGFEVAAGLARAFAPVG